MSYFFQSPSNEKRSDLEEQQLHLNVGLQKIRETVDQVEELQASLSIKKNELEQKNALANQKLKQMVYKSTYYYQIVVKGDQGCESCEVGWNPFVYLVQ